MSAKTIGIIQVKGGAGRSTVSTNLGFRLTPPVGQEDRGHFTHNKPAQTTKAAFLPVRLNTDATGDRRNRKSSDFFEKVKGLGWERWIFAL